MAQIKSEIFGHQQLFGQWTQLIERKQLTGSFLFVGQSGIGKKKSAWAMIQQTLCENKISLEACGECGSCRRVASRQHESVLFIEPEGAQIKVEQGQQILQFLQLKALTSHRFVLVDDAHKMNASTANSLLKTLEEPVDGTTLILLAPSLTMVLPTIRSRLRIFHFKPVSLKNLEVSSSEKQFQSTWAEYFVNFLMSAETLTDDLWRDALKNKEEFRPALELWLKMTRDTLFLQQGEKESLLTLGLNQQLQKLVALPSEKLQKIGKGLIDLQRELSFNKDAVLSLESLYIGLKK